MSNRYLQNMTDNKVFFDDVSAYYDDMISYEHALKKKMKVLPNIIGTAKTAADIGCGTGIDSIVLSKLGLKTVAFDQSDSMIERARANAAKENAEIEFENFRASDIPPSFFSKFDLVISLGNTFANIENEMLPKSVKVAGSLLKPNGIFVIHVLNYDLVKRSNDRIVSITDDYEYMYIRFYDIFENYFNFNILRYSKTNYKERSLMTTILYPHSLEVITKQLSASGLENIDVYGGLQLNKFIQNESRDLVIIASTGAERNRKHEKT